MLYELYLSKKVGLYIKCKTSINQLIKFKRLWRKKPLSLVIHWIWKTKKSWEIKGGLRLQRNREIRKRSLLGSRDINLALDVLKYWGGRSTLCSFILSGPGSASNTWDFSILALLTGLVIINYLLLGAVLCRLFGSTPCLSPPNINSSPLLPQIVKTKNVSWGQNHPRLRTTVLQGRHIDCKTSVKV